MGLLQNLGFGVEGLEFRDFASCSLLPQILLEEFDRLFSSELSEGPDAACVQSFEVTWACLNTLEVLLFRGRMSKGSFLLFAIRLGLSYAIVQP